MGILWISTKFKSFKLIDTYTTGPKCSVICNETIPVSYLWPLLIVCTQSITASCLFDVRETLHYCPVVNYRQLLQVYTSNKQPRLQVAPNCKVYPQSTVMAKQSRFQVAPTCKGVPPINSHGYFMVSVLGDCTHDLIGRQVRIDTWSIVSTCWRYSISHLFPQSVDTSLSPASLASDNR